MTILRREIELDHAGTKIVIDGLNLITTITLILMGCFLIAVDEGYVGAAILFVAAIPYAHEYGHYHMAKDLKYGVSELRFTGNESRCIVDGIPSHRHTVGIALAGELMTGAIFIGIFLVLLNYGLSVNSPFTILTAIIPCMWIITWLHKDSDMNIALKSYHLMKSDRPKNRDSILEDSVR